MARPKKKPTPAAQKRHHQEKKDAEIKRAAELAAADAVAEFGSEDEEEDLENLGFRSEDNSDAADSIDENPGLRAQYEKDVFEDGFQKAKSMGQGVKYWIIKDSQFLTVKIYPYSWEKLQKDYGPGVYQVRARGLGGQIYMQQTEIVGDPRTISDQDSAEPQTQETHQGPQQMGFMEMYAMMNQVQEKSEVKNAQAQTSQNAALTTMMQFMIQSQQAASQQFQTLMIKMNDQAQEASRQQMNLVTTLLTTQSANKDKGFGALEMLKMIQDSAKNAEDRTKSWFELVDKKAELLAEQKAEMMSSQSSGEEKEESFSKTLIKGFIPVLTQLMHQQQQPPGSALPPGGPPPAAPQIPDHLLPSAQEEHMRRANLKLSLEREAHLRAQRSAQGAPSSIQQVHNAVIMNAAEAPSARALSSAPEGGALRGNGGAANVTPAPQPDRPVGVSGTGAHASNGAPPNGANSNVVRNVGPLASSAEQNLNRGDKLKEKIIEIVSSDVAQGYLLKKSPGSTAEVCLKKLEKAGILRQNVLSAFSLADCFELANKYGVLEKAKPWITEFYEVLAKGKQVAAAPDGKSARTDRQASAN